MIAAASPPGILHLTAAIGGGVDRYIRDAAANSDRRHFVWHAGDAIDVIEEVAARRFTPLRNVAHAASAADAIDAWRRGERIGLVHLHGVDRGVRARFAMIDAGLPALATLHDVGFISPNVFDSGEILEPDRAWSAEVAGDLARLEALIVPSDFMRREAERAFAGKTIVDIAPGIAPRELGKAIAAPVEFVAHAPRHVVAVVGAIGPHKGSKLVEALSYELRASGVTLVVIGYTNERMVRSWVDGDRYYVHGPYDDAQLLGLLAAYRVDVVVFPNRLPESFSYTLSEVWAARVPVIVPDDGALGERVARHGGGWRLPARFGAAQAAALIRELFDAGGERERTRVKSQIDPFDADRIPTLASMSRALDRLYERFAAPAQGTAERVPAQALAPLLAANLDGFAFRAELLHFAEDLDNARTAITELQSTLADTRDWASKVDGAAADARAWAAKLERDIDTLKHEVELRDAQLKLLPTMLRVWLRKRALRDRG